LRKYGLAMVLKKNDGNGGCRFPSFEKVIEGPVLMAFDFKYFASIYPSSGTSTFDDIMVEVSVPRSYSRSKDG
jgi:hypothetical protein